MAVWSVPATVLGVEAGGDVLCLRVELGGDVRTDARVRLASPHDPGEPLRPGRGALRYVRRRLAAGCRVRFVSDRRDRCGRPMGRLLYGPGGGRDLAADLFAAGLTVVPGGRGGPRPGPPTTREAV